MFQGSWKTFFMLLLKIFIKPLHSLITEAYSSSSCLVNDHLTSAVPIIPPDPLQSLITPSCSAIIFCRSTWMLQRNISHYLKVGDLSYPHLWHFSKWGIMCCSIAACSLFTVSCTAFCASHKCCQNVEGILASVPLTYTHQHLINCAGSINLRIIQQVPKATINS